MSEHRIPVAELQRGDRLVTPGPAGLRPFRRRVVEVYLGGSVIHVVCSDGSTPRFGADATALVEREEEE